MSVFVKICGVCRIEDADAAVAAGADAIGINFHTESRRYCPPQTARAIVAALPEEFPVYGVFVAAPRASVLETLDRSGVRGVQLHGDEPEEEALGWNRPVLRAVRARDREAVVAALVAAAAHGSSYRLLVDSARGGGSGALIDERVLVSLDLREALLAGGLTVANVAAMVARHRPFGVDCAGGVEVRPGVKDPQRMKEFIDRARDAGQ